MRADFFDVTRTIPKASRQNIQEGGGLMKIKRGILKTGESTQER